ncbi:MAG TPA: molecular chaperone, partial [Franconibacter helveticus]|nr:molecular chaperone [Franconibacter helveticus]
LFPLPPGETSPAEISASLNARDSQWLASPR